MDHGSAEERFQVVGGVCLDKNMTKSAWLQFNLFISPSSSASWSNSIDEGGVGGDKQSSTGPPETLSFEQSNPCLKLDRFYPEWYHIMATIFLWL